MNPPSLHPPLIAFIDERVEHSEGLTRIIAGCFVFGRDRWMARHQCAASVGAVGLRRRLAALDDFLNKIGGIAVVVYADIPSELLPTGETDGTDDIPRMSRADNLWSQVILSGITAALAWLQHSGVPNGVVDTYFDRRDLTSAHRAQLENILRQTLPEISREAATRFPELFGADPRELLFGTIAGVDKPRESMLLLVEIRERPQFTPPSCV